MFSEKFINHGNLLADFVIPLGNENFREIFLNQKNITQVLTSCLRTCHD